MYNHLYVDLLKRILCNSVYEDDYATRSPSEEDLHECTRFIAELENEAPHVLSVYPYLTPEKLADILKNTKVSRQIHTYVGQKGLDNVEACVRTVLFDDIAGDFLDAGVLRGGIGILMRGILKAADDSTSRKIVMADSFDGLPPPSIDDSVFDREVWYRFINKTTRYNLKCSCDVGSVKSNFEKYDLMDDRVEFLKGWFNETMPTLRSRSFAIVRIDVDWYNSCRDVLDNVYDCLSDGGFVIIDDYKLQGCHAAIDAFRDERQINDPIEIADAEAGIVYWRKNYL
ncbi:TylF/MycF/NovP-related O-methyltransferase [Paraburkholderia bannensis]|uniref:TylF/MycF/NovP-related O-methyltransferase n=1 Tax=Paraburkholderia bannensis TaxID=765414 RepID=UPI002AAF964D|nr:TylF/MycF/NovP-related O-methyltransferase [Paraburkholderia bannensis]